MIAPSASNQHLDNSMLGLSGNVMAMNTMNADNSMLGLDGGMLQPETNEFVHADSSIIYGNAADLSVIH